jgi:hypothetical protein
MYDDPISFFFYNTSAINISKNIVIHSRKKHISIKYHFLREKVMENDVNLEYVPTKDHISNILPKDIPKDTFEYLLENLGVISPPFLN